MTKRFLKKTTGDEKLIEFLGAESNRTGIVTEIIVTEVSPGMEKNYLAWSSKIHQAEAKFPGYLGAYVQPPAGKDQFWITLLQFDTVENLENWLESSERKAVLEESSSLISSLVSHRLTAPYAGWFSAVSKTTDEPLSVWKQAMLILLVLFPIVMLQMRFLSPLTASLNPAVGMFIANMISVALITFPTLPIAIYSLNWWLSTSDKKTTLLGVGIVIFLYLIEIAIFWNFS